MPSWFFTILLVAILLGISPILHNRAIQIHGPVVNLMSVSIIFVIFGSFWLFIHKQDLQLLTKYSFLITTLTGFFSFVATMLLFNVYKMATKDLSLITITASFSIVITAIINNFLGNKLAFHQWVGSIITLLGIILVNWKK